jgi:hypothetical protein
MQDPFIQVADDFDDDALMMRATDTPMPPNSSRTAIDPSSSAAQRGAGNFADVANRKIVCPFCGAINDAVPEEGKGITCPRCTMQDSPATRQATKSRIGPWFVRQNRNPSAPGMRFETLLMLVNRGQVTATSIVRGPTTHQLWRFAAQVKGLSREFGLCYSCGASIDRTASLCPHCNRLQEPPVNPDVLLEATAGSAPAGARPPAQPPASSTSPQPRSRKPAAAPPAEKPLPPAPAPALKRGSNNTASSNRISRRNRIQLDSIRTLLSPIATSSCPAFAIPTAGSSRR